MDGAVTVRGSNSKVLLVFSFVNFDYGVVFVNIPVLGSIASTHTADGVPSSICRSVCHCVILPHATVSPAKRLKRSTFHFR